MVRIGQILTNFPSNIQIWTHSWQNVYIENWFWIYKTRSHWVRASWKKGSQSNHSSHHQLLASAPGHVTADYHRWHPCWMVCVNLASRIFHFQKFSSLARTYTSSILMLWWWFSLCSPTQCWMRMPRWSLKLHLCNSKTMQQYLLIIH